MPELDYEAIYQEAYGDTALSLSDGTDPDVDVDHEACHAAALRVVAWRARQALKYEIAEMVTESPTRKADLTELLFGEIAKLPLRWKFTLQYTRVYKRKDQ